MPEAAAVVAAPIIHLTVIDGPTVHSLRVTGDLTRIGRDSSNELILRDRYISSFHAEVRIEAGSVSLRDLRSTNGTRVRRRRWVFAVDHQCGHQAQLEDGDEILLGKPSQEAILRVSVVDTSSAASESASGDGATIVESIACSSVPDVAERFGRSSMAAVQAISAMLRPKDEPQVVIESLAAGLLEQFPRATHVSVHLLDEASGVYLPSVLLGRTGREPPRAISATVRKQVVERGEGVTFVGRQSDSLQEASIQSGLCAPLWTGDRVPALVQVDRRGTPDSGFTKRELGMLVVIAHQAALVLELAITRSGLRETVENAIGGVVAVMEARDQYMEGHSQAVSELARRIAVRLALGPQDVALVTRAASLHDLGRFGISREILDKPGKLTTEEFRAVRNQPEVGASILERSGVLADLVPIILHLHENWDGSGYPSGLAGKAIPLGARIVAVADAFHTLISHRAHRQAVSESEALAEIGRSAGTRYDPLLVGVLEELMKGTAEAWTNHAPTVMGWHLDASGKPVED